MKAEVEYSTIETCDDALHILDFHARITIEEHVFLSMGGDPRIFMEELRHLVMRIGHELVEAAERPRKLERLWENRVRVRLSERKIPIIKPLTAKEAIDAD